MEGLTSDGEGHLQPGQMNIEVSVFVAGFGLLTAKLCLPTLCAGVSEGFVSEERLCLLSVYPCGLNVYMNREESGSEK